jgi:hypothetical protein
LPDDPVVAAVKVLPKRAVQLPPEVMERLGLKPSTKLIVTTAACHDAGADGRTDEDGAAC